MRQFLNAHFNLFDEKSTASQIPGLMAANKAVWNHLNFLNPRSTLRGILNAALKSPKSASATLFYLANIQSVSAELTHHLANATLLACFEVNDNNPASGPYAALIQTENGPPILTDRLVQTGCVSAPLPNTTLCEPLIDNDSNVTSLIGYCQQEACWDGNLRNSKSSFTVFVVSLHQFLPDCFAARGYPAGSAEVCGFSNCPEKAAWLEPVFLTLAASLFVGVGVGYCFRKDIKRWLSNHTPCWFKSGSDEEHLLLTSTAAGSDKPGTALATVEEEDQKEDQKKQNKK